MNGKHWLVTVLLLTGTYACKKELIESFAGFQTPANFPLPIYHFSTNSISKGGFELGRKLFYETKLSANNSISCGSCHIQTSAFTQHGHSVSHGIMDRLGTRNSAPIMNLAWSNNFMWDGGIFDLDLLAIAPISNHVEMDETMDNVLNKLRSSPQYPALFKKAYGSEDITTATFLKALSQFMLMCVSSNSKYDSVMRNEGGKTFAMAEQQGYAVFKDKCATCHAEPLFTDNSFRNNGISISTVNDEGRYLVTGNDEDKYTFKVPSLRNLAYSAPYMHDGRFFTVEAVLDHYTSQVQHTPNLDPALQHGIALSTSEKQQLRSFLQTLNDRTFITDQRFAEQ